MEYVSLPEKSLMIGSLYRVRKMVTYVYVCWLFSPTTAPDFEAVRLSFDCLLTIFFEPLVGVLGVVGGAISFYVESNASENDSQRCSLYRHISVNRIGCRMKKKKDVVHGCGCFRGYRNITFIDR